MSGSSWEFHVFIDNLAEEELELKASYVNEGPAQAPSWVLPSRFQRTARLHWRWTDDVGGERSAAAAYDLLCNPAFRLVVGVVLPSGGGLLSWMPGKGKAEGAPRLWVSFDESPYAAAAPSAQTFRRLLADAKPIGDGNFRRIQWMVTRNADQVVEIRMRLTPALGLPASVPAADASSEVEEDADEAKLKKLAAYRTVVAISDIEAAELERVVAAEPLDPQQIRELGDDMRMELIHAVLTTLLRCRRDAISACCFHSDDDDATQKQFRDALAKHADRVHRAVVQLACFQEERVTRKLSELCRMYLPGVAGIDREAEIPDPLNFCKALSLKLQQSQDEQAERTQSPWSAAHAFPLCQPGEESRFAGRIWLVDSDIATSPEDLSDALNDGVALCPEDFCVVLSASSSTYFVLPRRDNVVDAQKRCEDSSEKAGSSPSSKVEPLKFAEGTRAPRVWLVARQLLALVIGAGGGTYDARTRAVLLEMFSNLGVPPRLFARWESEIGGALFEAMEATQVLERQQKSQKMSKNLKIAGAAIGSGVLLAVTGGLAAPALGAGIASATASAGVALTSAASAVGLGLPGAIIGSAITGGGIMLTSIGTAGTAVLFGATGLGLTGWKMSTRWGSLEEFVFEHLSHSTRHMAVSVEVADKASVQLLDVAIESGSGRLLEDIVVPCAGGGQVALLRGSRCLNRSETSVQLEDDGHGQPREAAIMRAVQIVRFRFDHEVDSTQRAVHLAVFVSGWLSQPDDFSRPWIEAAPTFFPSSGHVSLKWERKQLERLNALFKNMVTQGVASQAASLWWKSSVAAATTAGSLAALTVMWPVWLMSSLANMDNAWMVVAERARQAGKCLAHVLADKHAVGQRPVTLIGHSMGARLILYCLLELFQRGEYNVVDDVVLLGTPATTKTAKWRNARAVVSGRLINGYLPQDWVLAFLYRYLEWGISVAGLGKVDVPGVENINLAGLGISGHHDYPNHILDILAMARIGERRARWSASQETGSPSQRRG